MALTEEQRVELEAHAPAMVGLKLLQGGAGRGASIPGFKCGDITRGDIEDWLIEKETSTRKSNSRQFCAMLILTAIAAVAACIAAWPVLKGG
jgi:hypothetical protein